MSTIDNHLTIGQNGTSASSGGALAAAGAGSPAVAGVPSTAAAAATSGTPLAIPAGAICSMLVCETMRKPVCLTLVKLPSADPLQSPNKYSR